MQKIKNFLQLIPVMPLAFLTAWMLIAPYPIAPEPHLVEKLKMLNAGTLTKAIDIFDVFWHLTPATLLILRLSWAKTAVQEDK